MSTIPPTSVSLLKAISDGTASARWTDFYHRYEPAMRGFLHERFPSVEAEDVIQEVLLALTRAMPNYHYTPDGNGHFRNWLMGIVKHKALDAINRAKRISDIKTDIAKWGNQQSVELAILAEDDSWMHSTMEAAMDQVMSDESITARTREVFRHVALMHEQPEDVARQFGISRNNVDQIKKRMISKLAALVSAMTAGYR
jgi:RNA polymerase sigma factor (sigma-70 family)